jgi:hypothetical protein
MMLLFHLLFLFNMLYYKPHFVSQLAHLLVIVICTTVLDQIVVSNVFGSS